VAVAQDRANYNLSIAFALVEVESAKA